MKFFITGLLLWWALVLPSSAGRIEKTEYRILTLNEKVRAVIENDSEWRTCGNYFAETEVGKKKVIHFAFEKRSSNDLSRVFAFTVMDRVVVSIHKGIATPIVIVLDNEVDTTFFLMMNMEDYKTGLPCLAKGIKKA